MSDTEEKALIARAEYTRAMTAAGAEYRRATATAWVELDRATTAARVELDRVFMPHGLKTGAQSIGK
jgi:hypothetical protein